MLPGKLVPRGSHLVMAERGAMRRRRALLIGGAIADDRVAIDQRRARIGQRLVDRAANVGEVVTVAGDGVPARRAIAGQHILGRRQVGRAVDRDLVVVPQDRSEEHTSELQSLMRISYAVFCWKKKKTKSYIIVTIITSVTSPQSTNYEEP